MEGEAGLDASANSASASAGPDHGWRKVTYPKRHRRTQPLLDRPNELPSGSPHVFASVEQKALDRRRAIESASAAPEAAVGSRPANAASDYGEEDSETEVPPGAKENLAKAAKKVKPKKPKKAKATVAEAAGKIDVADLASFLVDNSISYAFQQDIQLMRFADYFGRSFACVSASHFPWINMFKESSVAKMPDIPLCHISQDIYKISADWIADKSTERVGEFALWCLDIMVADMASQQVTGKGLKKHVAQTPPKAQVALFVVLAITLRRRPDILISLLPKLREDLKFRAQEKLPVIVWTITQASQGDVYVGMYLWAHYLFPAVCGKSSVNPQSRDLVLQLAERILAAPKAQAILRNGAIRKGERLMPPSAFDLLMWNTFPAPAARIKATERFKAIYPILRELALAGSAGTKTTKQASQQLFPLTVRAIQEGNPELAKEAIDVFIWCLLKNVGCYKQWEKLHQENIDASVAVLRELANNWKYYSDKVSSNPLRDTLEHLRTKNKEALSRDANIRKHASFIDADKYCKAILGKLTSHSGCTILSVLLILVIAVCLALSPRMELLAWEKPDALFEFLPSSGL